MQAHVGSGLGGHLGANAAPVQMYSHEWTASATKTGLDHRLHLSIMARQAADSQLAQLCASWTRDRTHHSPGLLCKASQQQGMARSLLPSDCSQAVRVQQQAASTLTLLRKNPSLPRNFLFVRTRFGWASSPSAQHSTGGSVGSLNGNGTMCAPRRARKHTLVGARLRRQSAPQQINAAKLCFSGHAQHLGKC
jgi:hypothetical protein